MKKPVSLVFVDIYLAVSCAMVGIVLVYALLIACQYYNIDLFLNWWLLAIPVVLAVMLNVMLIELYRKYRKR